MEFLFLALLFLLIAVITFGGFYFISQRRQRVQERLQAGSDPSIGSTPELILGDLTPAFAEQIPIAEADRSDLQRLLRTAGYYRPTALLEYAALRALLIFLPLLVAVLLVFLFTESFDEAKWYLIAGVIGAMLGFSLPRVYLYIRAEARKFSIERALPTAIDMISLCLTAGLNIFVSLERVVKELYYSFPDLAFELDIVRRQAEMRNFDFALAQFADRVGMPNVRNLSAILSQSESLGTDTVGTLREYADNMRFNMRQRAEEMANKAPFKLLFPAYMLAFGAGILLISPTVLELVAFFNRPNPVSNIGSDVRSTLPKFNPNTR
jgi:tight adherence protein C